MALNESAYDRSIREQIRINQARTPTERLQALCDLLDSLRVLAPMDPESVKRREAIQRAREREKEEMRAYFRKLVAAQREKSGDGV